MIRTLASITIAGGLFLLGYSPTAETWEHTIIFALGGLSWVALGVEAWRG